MGSAGEFDADVEDSEPRRNPLCALGIEPDEEAVYRLLLEAPGCTLAELEERSSLASERLHRAIGALTRRSLVSLSEHDPYRLHPAPLGPVVEAFASVQELELHRVRLVAHELMTHHRPPLNPLGTADLIEIVAGHDAMRSRFRRLRQSALRSIDSLVRSDLIGTLPELDRRGANSTWDTVTVDQRYLHDREWLAHSGWPDQPRPKPGNGVTRVVDRLPLTMVLFDRRSALVVLSACGTAPVQGLVVHDSSVLEALVTLFEHLWRRGIDVASEAEAPAGGPSSVDEDAVLVLLAGALKDEAIARKLGVSVHTVRRRISNVLEQLGVTTRFQAGLALGRGGWPTTSWESVAHADSRPAPD